MGLREDILRGVLPNGTEVSAREASASLRKQVLRGLPEPGALPSLREEVLSGIPRLGRLPSLREQLLAPIPGPKRGRVFSGGPLSDIGDVLGLAQYAVAGIGRRVLEPHEQRGFVDFLRQVGAGAAAGIRERESWIDVIGDKWPSLKSAKIRVAGTTVSAAGVIGLFLDMGADPTWLISPIKAAAVLGRGVHRAVRPVGAAAGRLARRVSPLAEALYKARAGAGAVREARQAGRLFERLDDLRRIGEATTAKNAMRLAEEMADFAKGQVLKQTPEVTSAGGPQRFTLELLSHYIESRPWSARLGQAPSNLPARRGRELAAVRQQIADLAQSAGIDRAGFRVLGDRARAMESKMGREIVQEFPKAAQAITTMQQRGGHLRLLWRRHEEPAEWLAQAEVAAEPATLRLAEKLQATEVAGALPTARAIPPSLDAVRDVAENLMQRLASIQEAGLALNAGQTAAFGRLAQRTPQLRPILARAQARLAYLVGNSLTLRNVMQAGDPVAAVRFYERRARSGIGRAQKDLKSLAFRLRIAHKAAPKLGLSDIADDISDLRGIIDSAQSSLAEHGEVLAGVRSWLDRAGVIDYLAVVSRRLERPGFGRAEGPIDLGFLQARKQLTPEMQQFLGTIPEAPRRLVVGQAEAAAGVERARMYRSLAAELGQHIAPPRAVISRGAVGKFLAKSAHWLGWHHYLPGYQRLPDTAQWGALRKMWVPEGIWRELQDLARSPSEAERALRWVTRAWKYGKVVLNPATHFRNMYSNALLAHLGGVNPLSPRLYAEALRDTATQSGDWAELAKHSTSLAETWVGAELRAAREAFRPSVESGLRKVLSMAAKGAGAAGRLYQFEEQLFKVAVFKAARRRGLGAAAAAHESEKWLFNYRKVPKLVGWARESPFGWPFVTFTYKALPRIGEAAVTKPAQLSVYTKAMRLIRGPETREVKREERALPEWMRSGGHLRLPWKDEHGRSLYLDLTYILPWGDIAEAGSYVTEYGALPQMPRPAHPLAVMWTELATNQSMFTGRPIVPPGTSVEIAKRNIVDYIGKTLGPSWMPAMGAFKGGYSYSNFVAARKRMLDWAGRHRSVALALLSGVTGLKIRPVTVSIEEARRRTEREYKARDISAAITRLRKEAKLGGLEPGWVSAQIAEMRTARQRVRRGER